MAVIGFTLVPGFSKTGRDTRIKEFFRSPKGAYVNIYEVVP